MKSISVPIELLEDMLNPCADFATHERLRALLDAQHVVCRNGILCQNSKCAECGGNSAYKSQYAGMNQAQAQAVSDGVDEILRGKTAQPYQRCTILKECNVKSSPASGARINSIAKPITRRICHGCVGLPRDVFCPVCDDEKPATVADHPQCEECKGWGYHENHHEGGGAECGECGGSGNATVAEVMVMPDRMKVEPFTTIDRGSKNYKAGYNAAIAEVAKLNGLKT